MDREGEGGTQTNRGHEKGRGAYAADVTAAALLSGWAPHKPAPCLLYSHAPNMYIRPAKP